MMPHSVSVRLVEYRSSSWLYCRLVVEVQMTVSDQVQHPPGIIAISTSHAFIGRTFSSQHCDQAEDVSSDLSRVMGIS